MLIAAGACFALFYVARYYGPPQAWDSLGFRAALVVFANFFAGVISLRRRYG